MTMKEKIGNIEGKKVVIVGDIEHSRVAKSNITLMRKANLTEFKFTIRHYRKKSNNRLKKSCLN